VFHASAISTCKADCLLHMLVVSLSSMHIQKQLHENLVLLYSEICEIRTPLGRAKSVPNSEVYSFHMAICTENSSLGPDEVSLFHRMSSFRRVATHRFHCTHMFVCLMCRLS
jgi:hypothetical protein